MRKIFLLSFMFIYFFLILDVKAGLMTFEESIVLNAGDKKKRVGMGCVWTPVDASYKVELSDNLDKFVDFIEPDRVDLVAIDCPQEPEPRRACIKDQCFIGTDSARLYTIYFSAPNEIVFDMENGLPYLKFIESFPWVDFKSKEQKYEGGLRTIKRQGSAVGTEVRPFTIFFSPLNGWAYILMIGIIIVITSISILSFLWIRKTFFPKYEEVMYCQNCNNTHNLDVMYCPRCGSALSRINKKR